MKKNFTRTNLSIFGSFPTFWESLPPLSEQLHSDLPFWTVVLSVYSAPHIIEHPQLVALYDLICSPLFFITICPWESLSCPASSWCQMIPNTGPFTIGKFLLIHSLTQKSIFLLMIRIPSSALLPATHLCWLIRSESSSFSFSSS